MSRRRGEGEASEPAAEKVEARPGVGRGTGGRRRGARRRRGKFSTAEGRSGARGAESCLPGFFAAAPVAVAAAAQGEEREEDDEEGNKGGGEKGLPLLLFPLSLLLLLLSVAPAASGIFVRETKARGASVLDDGRRGVMVA